MGVTCVSTLMSSYSSLQEISFLKIYPFIDLKRPFLFPPFFFIFFLNFYCLLRRPFLDFSFELKTWI